MMLMLMATLTMMTTFLEETRVLVEAIVLVVMNTVTMMIEKKTKNRIDPKMTPCQEQ